MSYSKPLLYLLLLFGLMGCAAPETTPPTNTPARQPTSTPTAVPTQPLPHISLDEATDTQPYPITTTSETASGYPAQAQTASILPAPVLLPTEIVVPPTLTPIATAVLPTRTPTSPAPTATPAATLTPPALPATSENDHYWFLRPIGEGGVVWTDKTYPYGGTRNNTLRTHHGVEFNVTYDTPVLAVANGRVVFAGFDDVDILGPDPNFYGTAVVIQHEPLHQGQPIFTLYAHLNNVNVAVGQTVQARDVIGYSGATGVADGPHLHFEVRVGENSYTHTRNPLLWLYPFPERGTIAGRVVFLNGALALQAPIALHRIDGGEAHTAATTTYADNIVNSDELWQENFVLDDVPAGYYEVTVRDGNTRYKEKVWVYPRQTSFVEIVVQK